MSQNTTLLHFLKKNGEIDPMTSLRELGIYRLASRVHDLREMGVKIDTLRNPDTGFSKYLYKGEVKSGH